jgi:hypothetical protein
MMWKSPDWGYIDAEGDRRFPFPPGHAADGCNEVEFSIYRSWMAGDGCPDKDQLAGWWFRNVGDA